MGRVYEAKRKHEIGYGESQRLLNLISRLTRKQDIDTTDTETMTEGLQVVEGTKQGGGEVKQNQVALPTTMDDCTGMNRYFRPKQPKPKSTISGQHARAALMRRH
jgi:hypothetical protein